MSNLRVHGDAPKAARDPRGSTDYYRCHNSFLRRMNKTSISLIIVFLISTLLSACSQSRAIIASFRSTDDFIPLSSDKRVLYEPGAETHASEIALLLPEAIQKVEAAHYQPFKNAVEVYICASKESCFRLTAQHAPATVTHKLFISPALFEGEKPIDRYLTHELSHLQLLQRVGTLNSMKLPAWFKEGLAEFVSGNATGAMVTDEEAERSLAQGRGFVPDDGRGLLASFFSPRYGTYWGMSQPLFYHQSMLFVRYLHTVDEPAFHRFLTEVQNGKGFKNALESTYHTDLAALWGTYLLGINAKASASPPALVQ
jgi:hypothetical protein